MALPPNSENAPSSKSSSNHPDSGDRAAVAAPSCAPYLISILTLFPDLCETVLGTSLVGKARQNGVLTTALIQIRDHARDKHHTVDDTPYGGGEGMLLKCDVLHDAWRASQAVGGAVAPSRSCTILLSPQGPLFTQDTAKELARDFDHLTLVCGHYEGVDERFIELCVDRELSIGDYVLTGGELPALVVADAVARLLPGVVGNERSVSQDSLEGGLLKYPQFTRPREYEGLAVPEVLLSGDHGAIEKWRRAESERRTRKKRPDLLRGSSFRIG